MATNKDRQEQLIQAHEQVNMAAYAKQIIDNPAYQYAMTAIRADKIGKFESSGYKQSDEREELWRQMKTIADFQKALENTMKTGKLAEQNIGKLEKLLKRMLK